MALSFVAPVATHIFGVNYAAGDPVDVSSWSPRAVQQALGRGWITPSAASSAPVGRKLYAVSDYDNPAGDYTVIWGDAGDAAVDTGATGLTLSADGKTFTADEDGWWAFTFMARFRVDTAGSWEAQLVTGVNNYIVQSVSFDAATVSGNAYQRCTGTLVDRLTAGDTITALFTPVIGGAVTGADGLLTVVRLAAANPT